MDSYLSNIGQYYHQQEEMKLDEGGCVNDSESILEDEQTSMKPTYPNTAWLHDSHVTSSCVLPPHVTSSDSDMFLHASSQAFVQNTPPHFTNQSCTQPISQITSQPTGQQTTPAYDIYGKPVHIRKKPGRKPNPTSPALRKAQNRAAQRAFRERKEKHLHNLETTIRTLREQRNAALKEIKALKQTVKSSKTEIWYLKGIVLTLQFMCLHYNMQIPVHAPYLSREDLGKIQHTTPHTIEAYIKAYTRNNENLKETDYYSFMKETASEPVEETPSPYSSPKSLQPLDSESMDFKPTHSESQTNYNDKEKLGRHAPSPTNNIDIIKTLEHLLGVKMPSKLSEKSKARLRPTILQLAVPHDPRIDIIPTPPMRDRMIMFRDQIDYDRCFLLLAKGVVYYGGDPTDNRNWELPPEFFSEYWYATIKYDKVKMDQWNQYEGSQKASKATTVTAVNQNNNNAFLWPNQIANLVPTGWNPEMYYEMIENMPVLQPFGQVGYPLTPSRSLELGAISNINASENVKPIYQNKMCAHQPRKIMNAPKLGSFHNLP